MLIAVEYDLLQALDTHGSQEVVQAEMVVDGVQHAHDADQSSVLDSDQHPVWEVDPVALEEEALHLVLDRVGYLVDF